MMAEQSIQPEPRAARYLQPEDIDQGLAYAAWRMEERDVPLTAPMSVDYRQVLAEFHLPAG